jgi:hypothetical protein
VVRAYFPEGSHSIHLTLEHKETQRSPTDPPLF